MNIDIDADLEPSDWLTLPHQRLRSICGGAVFRDDLGLESIRKRFAWYPHDVWLYLLASCWSRLGEEEHLMGRAGDFGDEIGSALIASRLVRDIMRLAFLMERVYPPYSKWFGTAFRELGCAEELEPVLEAVLNTRKWEERESSLCKAYGIVAKMHNNLEITEPFDGGTCAIPWPTIPRNRRRGVCGSVNGSPLRTSRLNRLLHSGSSEASTYLATVPICWRMRVDVWQ